MRLLPLTVCTAVLLSACGASDSDSDTFAVEFLNTPEMENLDLPFSDAVRAGPFLFVSGKIGNVPGTMDLAPGGIGGETRQALENIRTSLERNGASMNDVVKCTVFLADIGEWAAMNEVYKTFFPHNRPTRSALGVNGLALDARVEIECFAALAD
ncbi:MAG: RidA family protein [Gammaproteobacteria bacterium]|nr:RidA family protein [Gammaproteobacteria bacterium]